MAKEKVVVEDFDFNEEKPSPTLPKRKITFWRKMNLFNRIVLVVNLLFLFITGGLASYKFINTYKTVKASMSKLEKNSEENKLRELNYQKILQTYAYMEFKIFSFEKKYPDFAKITELAFKNATINKLSPYTVIAITQVESNFNPKAVSNKEAYGLMQVHYPTWGEYYKLKSPEDLFNPELNMELGCKIFKQYLDLCKGDVSKALYLYNAGFVVGVQNGYVDSVNKSEYNSNNKPIASFANINLATIN